MALTTGTIRWTGTNAVCGLIVVDGIIVEAAPYLRRKHQGKGAQEFWEAASRQRGVTLEWAPDGHTFGCDGTCPRWLAIDAPGCLPYPCQCETTQMNAPSWAIPGQCHYRNKHGWIDARCPDWGRPVTDDLPASCCARVYATVRTAPVVGLADPTVDADATLDGSGAVVSDVEAGTVEETPKRRRTRLDDFLEMDPSDPHDPGAWWPGSDPTQEPYKRRWTHEEVHCDCALPADWLRKGAKPGQHCTQCHHNFKSPAVFMIHQRSITGPCRAPATIVDAMTGDPVLSMRSAPTEGGEQVLVWG